MPQRLVDTLRWIRNAARKSSVRAHYTQGCLRRWRAGSGLRIVYRIQEVGSCCLMQRVQLVIHSEQGIPYIDIFDGLYLSLIQSHQRFISCVVRAANIGLTKTCAYLIENHASGMAPLENLGRQRSFSRDGAMRVNPLVGTVSSSNGRRRTSHFGGCSPGCQSVMRFAPAMKSTNNCPLPRVFRLMPCNLLSDIICCTETPSYCESMPALLSL